MSNKKQKGVDSDGRECGEGLEEMWGEGNCNQNKV